MDTRELLIQRLIAVCETVPGLTVRRNDKRVAESDLPVVIVFDGSERSQESDRHRHGRAPRRVEALPVLHVIVKAPVEDVAALLNGFREALIRVVQLDVQLADLTLDNMGATYLGCSFDHEHGDDTTGQMQLSFGLSYALFPDRLAPASGSAS